MNSGEINGELAKHDNRANVIAYLSSLDLTRIEKNKFYKYWKGTKAMQKQALQDKEQKRISKIRSLRK